jgi:glucose/arabinose dehydrogenase
MVAFVFVAVSLIPLRTVSAAPPEDFQTTPLITSGLEAPSGFEFAPDGRIFILERTGTIRVYKDGQLLPEPFAVLPSVAAGDRGLIGIAFDPEFEANCYAYFYYTGEDLLNRVVRFSACEDVAADGPLVIYQTMSPSQELHVGGSIQFGPDGKLYFAVGDNGYPPNGQDLSNPHGKILRINKDGSVPADNPFTDDPDALDEIWAYGFRNPWRFQFDPATGRLYGGDVGDFSWEEVNRIERGGNYGWPVHEGMCTSECDGYTGPIHVYPHDGDSAAVTGGPVYRGSMFPEPYQGALFFSDYAKGFIRYLTLDKDGNAVSEHAFDTAAGSVVDLKVAPDGSLYYITYFPGRLYRVTHDTGSVMPVASASADVTSGMDPLTVQFSSEGSSVQEGLTPTYHWDFGDGTTSDEPHPAKAYTEKGSYIVELTVSDGANLARATPIVIQVGEPPDVRISAPEDGSTYKAGDPITYNAFATDAAGFDINDADISTDVVFHHGTHTHPFLDDLIGRSNTFTIPDHGETSADTWYRITTTATDDNGLTATAAIEIHPETSELTVTSDIPGIAVQVDGIPRTSPYTSPAVVNFTRELSAPPIAQGADGAYYQFAGWSNNQPIRHTIRTPNADTTYTAHYEPASAFHAEYFDNPDLAGEPVHTGTEPIINAEWGPGSPDPSVPTDGFSARFTKNQYFAAGRYTFTAATDDGVRLFIDNELIIDGWEPSIQAHTQTIDLEEGTHTVRLEYFEAFGDAYARLNWTTAPDQPNAPYTAEYFANATLSGAPRLTRTDAVIDFDWGDGAPASNLPVDTMSARWTKTQSFTPGTYEFTVAADDGVRLLIDGEPFIDAWFDQAATHTVQAALDGEHTISLEYYEHEGTASAKLHHQKIAAVSSETYPEDGYHARYWNIEPDSVPAIPDRAADLVRSEDAVSFEWGNGSPRSEINVDHFVSRWQHHNAMPGTYRFTVTADDGVRLFTNGELILDAWKDQMPTTYTIEKTFLEPWNFVAEYYERAGGAVAKIDYELISTTHIPWTGEYWNTPDMGVPPLIPAFPDRAPDVTRLDTAVDFDWGEGVPAPGIAADRFMARWTKTDTFEDGTYRFTVTADDGMRVYLDGTLIIDEWQDQTTATYTEDVDIPAGEHEVVIAYYEREGGTAARAAYKLIE